MYKKVVSPTETTREFYLQDIMGSVKDKVSIVVLNLQFPILAVRTELSSNIFLGLLVQVTEAIKISKR